MNQKIHLKEHKGTVKEILQYIRPYWFFVVVTLILSGITVFLNLFNLKLIGDAVDCIIGKGKVDYTGLFKIAGTMGVSVFITSLSQWFMNNCNNKIVYNVIRDMRNAAFDKIKKLPLSYIDSHSSGDIVSRVIVDAEQLADGLLMFFTQFFSGILTIAATWAYMYLTNARISLVVLALTPLSIFTASFLAKSSYHLFRQQSELRGEQTGFLNEMIGNQKVVQAFGHEEEALGKFGVLNDRLKQVTVKALFFSSLTNPATRFLNGLVYTGVAVFGSIAVINGTLTVGSLTCFLNYANQYTKPFNEVTGVITELQNALTCAKRIFDLMEEESEEPDALNSIHLTDVKGDIHINHVNFSYDPNRTLIQDFNLNIKAGQKIAVVGPTGCGKTTLINLLMRFYEVQSGNIEIDTKDIKAITRKSLRRNFGMVLQDTWIKPGTIKENISLGKPEAEMEDIVTAAELAHVHNVIMRMPNGYDTILSEEGGDLSQGEKQLLCIARVMLCMPPMLILDEATSSIDTRTEIKIQEALYRLMRGRTSFIIAHRLSTIENADVILVMKDGKIVESGTHEELLKMRGLYLNLYNSQFSMGIQKMGEQS